MFDDLRELYQDVILDHGRNPRNHRAIEGASCTAEGNNPLCGDEITVFVQLGEDDVISDCAFQGRGCAISQASASMMTEILAGKSLTDAKALFENFHDLCTKEDYLPPKDGANLDALERLQVLAGVREFPMRVKCATLAWHTLQAAVTGDKDVSTE